MKNSLKKSIVTLLAIFTLLMAVAFLGFNYLKSDKAYADSMTELPSYTQEASGTEDGFYMDKGASVRTDEGRSGIRFTAFVTESYFNSLKETYGDNYTYEFYTEVIRSDNTQSSFIKKFDVESIGFENGICTLYTSIVYDDDTVTEDQLKASYSLELTAKTYMFVSYVDSQSVAQVVKITAASDAGYRSMKVVANNAVLAGVETDDNMKKYYGERVSTGKGYGQLLVNDADGDSKVEVAAFNGAGISNGTLTDVYIDAIKYSGNVVDGELSLLDVPELDASKVKYVSFFAENKVYTTTLDVCTEKVTITEYTDFKTLTLGDQYVVLEQDIANNNGVWIESTKNDELSFTGVFDGNNHRIGTHRFAVGMFYRLAGVVKNVEISAWMRNDNTGVVAYNVVAPSIIKNVYVEATNSSNAIDAASTNLGGLVYTCSAPMRVENVIVEAYTQSNTTNFSTHGLVAAVNYSDQLEVVNSYFSGLSGNILASQNATINKGVNSLAASSKNYGVYAKKEDLGMKLVADRISVGSFVEEKFLSYNKYDFTGITLIDKQNLNDLTTDSSTDVRKFYLMEDIDFSTVSGYSPKTGFCGELDGRGHTISNIKPTAVANSHKGFFNVLWNGAKITNIAFTDVDLSSGERVGLFGDLSPGRAVTLKDVFITIKDTTLPKASGLISYGKGGSLIMADVFIHNKATTSTNAANTGLLIGRHLDSAVSMSLYDCNFIVENRSVFNSDTVADFQNDGLVGNALGSTTYLKPTIGGNGYGFYEGLSAFKADENKKINSTSGPFAASCIEKYLSVNA